MTPPHKNSPSAPTTVTQQPADGPSDKTPPGDAQKPRSAGRRRVRRALRVLGRTIGWTALIGILLVTVLLLVVQTGWGSQKVGEALIDLANPFEGATLDVGRIRGNWVTTLDLHDVNVTRADSVRMIHVDSIQVRHRLLALWQRTYHARSLYVAGPVVTMEQGADTTWDLLAALLPDTVATDTTSSTFVVQIDQIRLKDGRVDARFYAPGRDSTARLETLNLRGGLTVGPTTAFRLDTLWTALTLPGQAEPSHLQARTHLADGRLTLTTLRLDAPGSHITAYGHLRLPDDTHDGLYGVDMTLDATPLAVRDLYPFLPTLEATETIDLKTHVEGTADLLDIFAEAHFSDGASLSLRGEATPSTEGPLTYQVREGKIRGFDPSVFTGDPAMEGRINADLRADLHGPALDSLSGTLHADIFNTRYGDYAFDPTTLRATFTDGHADVTLLTGLRDANLSITGTLRPLDEMPVYDFLGRFDSLDVGRFVEDQSSQFRGALHLAGRGFDLTQTTLTATLDLGGSRYNQQHFDDGLLTAALADGTVNVDAWLRMGADSLTLQGAAQLGDTLRYQIREARFYDLDVAALLGDTTESALTGTLALRGEGIDPATMTLDEIRLDLDDSSYGPYHLFNALAAGTLRNGLFDLSAEADLDGGAFTLDGTLRPFDTLPAFTLTRVDFEHVNVGTLMQDSLQYSDFNGTLRLAGRGFDPAMMTLDDARLTLSDSYLNEQPIDALEVTASLQRDSLIFDTRLVTPEGATTFAGGGKPFDETPAFRLTEGTVEGLNLGALLGLPHLDTQLHGTIDTLTVRGYDPQTMALQVAVTLDTSRVNQETIVSGALKIELRDGMARVDTATITLARGRIRLDTLEGRFFDTRPTYKAAGSIQNVDLARLSGLDTLQLNLSADFDVEGSGLDPRTMRVTKGRLDARNTRYFDLDVRRLQTLFSLNDGLLQVDTLTLRSNVADAAASGAIALYDTAFAVMNVPTATFTLQGTLRDEQPLRPFIPAETFSLGDGAFEATVTSKRDTVLIAAHAEVTNVVYDEVRALALDARVSGMLNRDRTLTVGTVEASLSRFSIPTLAVRYSEFSADFKDDELDFQANVTVDGRRDARLRGRADLGGETRHVVLETLNMHLDDDRWQLDQEATITYGDEYRVSNLLLVEDDQEIALDGVIDLDGTQSFGLTIYNFRIGSIADLFDFPGLDGTLNGDLFLTGPATAPRVNGSLDLDVVSFNNPVGKLQMAVDYDSLRLNLDATLAHQDASPLELRGYLPLDLRLSGGNTSGEGAALESEVSLRLDAEQFNIGWVEPFLDPEIVNEVEGLLTAHVNVSGTLNDPALIGEATFSNGRLGLPLLGVTYTDIAADVELAEDTVYVNHIEVHSGGGSAIGHGTVDLPQLTFGEFDIDASVENFRVIQTRPYKADVSADLNLSGTTSAPLLTGTVRLLNADIRPSEESTDAVFGPVTFTEEDVQMLERYFGIRVTAADTTTFVLYDALAMDLNVDIERDVWLRSRKNPEMNILLTGSLDLKKASYQDQRLTGTVLVSPERSYIKQFGRRFDIRNGRVTFVGPATDPLLDFEAAYNVPSSKNQDDEITIKMIVQGSMGDPNGLTLELSSEPVNLDQADIISYIATGRPAAEAFQLSGGGTLEVGTDLALNQLTGLIASAAGAGLGLDVVEIQQEGKRGTTVTAGKYISRRFFASVSWPISFSNSTSTGTDSSNREVIIEYEIFNWLLIRVISDGTTIGFNLLYQYAY